MRRTVALTLLIAACGGTAATTTLSTTPAQTTTTASPTTTGVAVTTTIAVATTAAPPVEIGDFPVFPEMALPDDVATSLEAVLDAAVQDSIPGVIASVVVGDGGSWSGAAGVDAEGNRLTPASRLLTASVGKTVTAAQVLHMVDEGQLELDDLAVEHFPSEIAFFDANGATVRDLLGMRSGIADPPGYISLVDSGSTPAELVEEIGDPLFRAGSQVFYANINYILLGLIIEHVTGGTLWEALDSGVLDGPGLGGLVYEEESALAADGWRIEADSASLARWGYELYGGSVLSDASLGEMTDFRDDWYGLGAIDFSKELPELAGGSGIPAIGHGGLEPANAVMLVAFPQTQMVVAVQARVDSVPAAQALAGALREAAQH